MNKETKDKYESEFKGYVTVLINVNYESLSLETLKTEYINNSIQLSNLMTSRLNNQNKHLPFLNIVINYDTYNDDDLNNSFERVIFSGRHYHINVFLEIKSLTILKPLIRDNIFYYINIIDNKLSLSSIYKENILNIPKRRIPLELEYELIKMWGIPPGIDPRPVFSKGGPHFHDYSNWLISRGIY